LNKNINYNEEKETLKLTSDLAVPVSTAIRIAEWNAPRQSKWFLPLITPCDAIVSSGILPMLPHVIAQQINCVIYIRRK